MEIGEKETKGKKRKAKFIFWNIAGIEAKDRDFWSYLIGYDFIGLCETWLTEERWDKIKYRLPNSHEWVSKHAIRVKGRGRASGGIIIGKRKNWGSNKMEVIETRGEGIMHIKVREEAEEIRIFTVYNSTYGREIGEVLAKELESYENDNIIIGGDFNIRIGEKGGDEEEGGIQRKSKDKTVGNGSSSFMEILQGEGFNVLNGRTKGDWEGEYTYVGARGSTVIDYIFVNEKIQDRVSEFRVGERVDSDHMPVCMELGTEEEEHTRSRRHWNESETQEENRKVVCWNEEARKRYRDKTEEMEWVSQPDESVDSAWLRLKGMVKEAFIYKERKIKKSTIGHKDWWDKSCTRRKRKVKRIYKSWKLGKGTREKYIEERKGLRTYLEEKRKKKREEEEEELRSIHRESEVWKFINRKRNKREWKENNIEDEVWRKHFMELLGGEDIEETLGQEMYKQAERFEDQKEVEEEEIGKAVMKLKVGKAVGTDGIPLEAWRYGGEAIKKGLIEVIRKAWRDGVIPEEWRKSIIVPLYKRGEVENAENYRGISLLCSAYKIYAEVLCNRLCKEAEEKKMLPESQAGFRKGRSTVDNIYILNHVIQREKTKEESKVYALFIDLKAAFDNVDRDKLWDILKNKGVEKNLANRIKKMYEHTEATVRTKDGVTRGFMVNKGVRQGCVMSPTLFNLYIADLDRELEKRGIGGVAIGKVRIWSLAYADDMVLLAKNKVALEDMMDTLKRFLKDRKLEICVEKTKIGIFNSKGRGEREVLKWKKKKLEEVRSFKYLGFVFNRNGNYNGHIKELNRKGRRAAKKVWGLGERICKDDFSRRWMLYRYLVQSTMSYGVEIWGWEEKKELEKIMLDYVRWVFRLDFCTPRYVILRELGLEKLKIRWGLRAVEFEEKIRRKSEDDLVKKCWLEKEEVAKREPCNKDLYSSEKAKYYNRNGWSPKAIEGMRTQGIDIIKEIRVRERDIQLQMIEGKIREAKYNKKFKEIVADRPSYLLKENLNKVMKGEGVRGLIRVRCGNMEENNKYWIKDEDRLCIFCGVGQDEMKHYIEECSEVKCWFEELGRSKEERMQRLWDDKLDDKKGRIIERVWKERERKIKERNSLRKEMNGVNLVTESKSDAE